MTVRDCEKLERVWVQTLRTLEEKLARPSFESWVRPARILGMEEGTVTIGATSPFAKSWIEHSCLGLIREHLTEILGDVKVRVELIQEEDALKGLGYETPEEEADRRREQERKAREHRLVAEGGFTEKMIAAAEWDRCPDSTEGLRKAIRTGQRLAACFPKWPRYWMLEGPTGCGKSTILRTLSKAIALAGPYRVVYVSCWRLDKVLREDRDFERRALEADLFVPDDLDKGLAGDSSVMARAFLKRLVDRCDEGNGPILASATRFTAAEIQEIVKKRDFTGRLVKLFHWQHTDGPDLRLVEETKAERDWWLFDD